MLKHSLIIAIFCTLPSCAWVGQFAGDLHARKHGSTKLQAPAARTLSNAEACTELRENTHTFAGEELDGKNIRLLNWNTQKHGNAKLHSDLSELSAGADLILLQETLMGGDHANDLDSNLYWNFAPGYIKSGQATGVMTGSKVAPMGFCKLAILEPWLGSPKATSITRYALQDRDDTLLVINMHMINFTLTTETMRTQLHTALDYARNHPGPIILSGDLNTWSDERMSVADSALRDAGLQPVAFVDDKRKQIFGLPVDHIYVRGMEWTTAQAYTVGSSDHNPITATLSVY